jgi:small-conductance mechanosensitive channel
LRARIPPAIALAGLVLLSCVLTVGAFAQGGTSATQPTPEGGVPLIYRGQEIVRIYRGLGSLGPVERARLASERLDQFVRDPSFDPTRVTVRHSETFSELIYDDRVLGVITDEDAQAAGRPRPEFARQVRDRLVEVVTSTREEFSVWSIAIGLGWAALATAILAALLWLLARLGSRVHARVDASYQRLTADPRVGRAAARATRLGPMVHSAVLVATAGAALSLVAVWLQVVLQLLPWSRPYARLVYRYLSEPIRTLWLGLLGYVPNFFYLAVIALTTFLVLRVVRIIFKEIEFGNIRLSSFPADWAEPTYKLMRALLLAVAFVGAFPYIPGSQTTAFQGISLFLGLLVSLSSSTALSNIIAGTILTYTRSFRVGDIVRIGETFGEVTVKRLLVTHVRTYKNIVVSIPNSLILTTQVLNYTTLAAERGLIAHTSVTIGYDAPWRKVHELLIAAARRTEGVLADPPPFVLQTALNDFSVSYEINAFVSSPFPLPRIYSTLHANIQESFNEAGMEIMSPNYFALRDGNQMTTPRQHLPSDYVAPAFRVR